VRLPAAMALQRYAHERCRLIVSHNSARPAAASPCFVSRAFHPRRLQHQPSIHVPDGLEQQRRRLSASASGTGAARAPVAEGDFHLPCRTLVILRAFRGITAYRAPPNPRGSALQLIFAGASPGGPSWTSV